MIKNFKLVYDTNYGIDKKQDGVCVSMEVIYPNLKNR